MKSLILILVGPPALVLGARLVGGSSLVGVIWRRYLRWSYLFAIPTLSILLAAGYVEGSMKGFDGDSGRAFGAVGTLAFLCAASGLIAWLSPPGLTQNSRV